MQDWRWMSASDLGRRIASGEIDPVDLTECFLEALSDDPDHHLIYARPTTDRARKEALAARDRARSDTRRSLLDGVPISWKDLFDTAGVATESGSRLLKDRIPDQDAEVLYNAGRAGLVCLGKTHQTELAFSGLGVNPMTATPPNGLDAPRAPGGSSSGAAVSVRRGLAAAGIGSDTGGSVRVPSVWNDLVGLKTTHGALSLEGVVPLCAEFDTVGPLSRTVEDACQLNAAMGGAEAPDLSDTSLSGKTFLVLKSPLFAPIDDAPQAAFEGALSALGKAGAKLVEGPAEAADQAMEFGACLYTVEAYATWGREIEANPDAMYGPIRERFEAGLRFSGVDYARAWLELRRLRAAYLAETCGYDAVLMPTAAILPPMTANLLADETYFMEKNLLALRNTRVANLMGLCALTLPTGTPHCGLMMMCPPHTERVLLQLGAGAEKALS